MSNPLRVPGMNLLGYVSVIPLLFAVRLTKTRRLTFDRNAGKVSVAARGVLGRSEASHPPADLQGTGLASDRSGNSGTTYKAVMRFAGPTDAQSAALEEPGIAMPGRN